MKNSHRIIFNTGVTYARAMVTSLLSLYATRLILQSLGAEDFGLYNVIGGLIAMLTFLNAAMTTSTQRYVSVNLGKKDLSFVKTIFANSQVIHLVIGIVVVLLIESVGLYFINNKLQIDPLRIGTAKYILHFTALSTFLTVISVPYDAVINAHENMIFLAVVSIIEAVLKLGAAVSLIYIDGDKLFYYGLFILLVAIIIRVLKAVYAKKKYEECNISIKEWYRKDSVNELTTFASWQMFGTLCSLGRNQGVAVVLNLFYSTVVNAAYGIANQINGQIMFFSQAMMSAVRPQIMKSEGSNDRQRMIKLSLSANRLSFYLFSFFAVPLYFQMSFLLDLWLTDVPQYALEFCRAILLLTAANQINMGLMTAVQAIGKIKVYQMVAGGIQLLTLPIGYFFLAVDFPPYSVVLVSFVLECLSTVFRIFYFRYLTGYSVQKYLMSVILRSLLTVAPCVFILSVIEKYLPPGFLGFVTCIGVSVVVYSTCIFLFGLDTDERNIFNGILKKIRKKLK